MVKAITQLKGWGNSIGVVLPKDKLDSARLGVGDEVEISVSRRSFPLNKAFGKLKGVKARSTASLQALVQKIDRDLGSIDKKTASNKKNSNNKKRK